MSHPHDVVLYLVTKSDDYYPTAGVTDWRLLTPDKNVALSVFEATEPDGGSKYLIALHADGDYRVLDTEYGD